MCTHGRWITNRYTDSRFWCKCGHCPSCQQEKAASRASRIRREYSDDHIVLFGTLTYKNQCVPYIKRDDISNNVLRYDVFRDFTHRGGFAVYKNVVVDTFNLGYVYPSDLHGLKDLKKRKGKIGVIYYKDLQNFFKRLRINLKRHYDYDTPFKFFACAEYGGKTLRPHFHFLVYIRPSDEEKFRRSIVASWPFANRSRTEKFIEVARDAAGYVSSYVNRGAHFPAFLSNHFPPKATYSKHFGHNDENFTLDKILQKTSEGYLRYFKLVKRRGIRQISDFLIPKYVINRYFPVFKGYSRLPVSALPEYIYDPSRLRRDSELREVLNLTDDDLHKIEIRLNNAYELYHSLTGRSRFRYAIDYCAVWRVARSSSLRYAHELAERRGVPVFQQYDNSYEVYEQNRPSMMYLLDEFDGCELYVTPNDYPVVIDDTLLMERTFDSYSKYKAVNNEVFSAIYDDV